MTLSDNRYSSSSYVQLTPLPPISGSVGIRISEELHLILVSNQMTGIFVVCVVVT
jgi:hypothetical protein